MGRIKSGGLLAGRDDWQAPGRAIQARDVDGISVRAGVGRPHGTRMVEFLYRERTHDLLDEFNPA